MRLADRYRLTRRIASGGMGTVHEGVDERLGRRVAVKLLKDEYADDPRFVERFGREARAAASLSHANIAQVLDFGQHDAQHFIVMEYVDGDHLGRLLREQGRLSPGTAVDLAAQVCSALSAAHAAGIVHRDIKPGNVMVKPDGGVKVTDFGIAQVRGQASLTGTGAVLGTVHYLSPEQAAGQGAGPASDLYSVGVLLFELLTGAVPFTDDSPVAVALSHIRDDLPSVRDLAPDVPAAVAEVVTTATAKDPRHRYADAAQMQAALRSSLTATHEESPTSVLPAAPESRSEARARRVPRHRLLAAAGLLLVAALAVGWWALTSGTSPQPADAGPAQAQPTARQARLSPHASPAKRTSAPSHTAAPRPQGPVMPGNAVGSNVKTLEDRLKDRGYQVQKVDVASDRPKDSVVATIPEPGGPLAAGQSVVLVASKGEPPEESTGYIVPQSIVGSDARASERQLRDQDLEVKKVDIDSTRPKDTVLATYPAPGEQADAGTVVLAVSTGP